MLSILTDSEFSRSGEASILPAIKKRVGWGERDPA